MPKTPFKLEDCTQQIDDVTGYREQIPRVADKIINHCDIGECFTHINNEPIPSKGSVIEIVKAFRRILFPGYFDRQRLDPVNFRYTIGQAVATLFDALSGQVLRATRHECFRYKKECESCRETGHQVALEVLEEIPALRKKLAADVHACFENDPAAKSLDEVIFSYPGIFAIMVYRIAHELSVRNVPLLPRTMTEYAHSVTGIDIHPGARIGDRFAIDHGTGVVIGETTVIGNRVRIYQGVTLGALSLPPDAVDELRTQKRHPTIEDDVIIYSGTTILGGETVIGARSVIGGNVWLTQSVEPDTTVFIEAPKLIYKSTEAQKAI